MSSCPVCLQNYHSENVVPVVLNSCGHSLCRSCLQQIINTTTMGHISRCPTCRTGINNNGYVTNWCLLPVRDDSNNAVSVMSIGNSNINSNSNSNNVNLIRNGDDEYMENEGAGEGRGDGEGEG